MDSQLVKCEPTAPVAGVLVNVSGAGTHGKLMRIRHEWLVGDDNSR